MIKRPLSVTIISWYLIIGSGAGLLYLPFTLDNPMAQQFMQTMGGSPIVIVTLNIINGIVTIMSGAAMLKRRVWGRTLYLVATPAGLLLSTAVTGFTLLLFMLMGLVMYGLIAFFLTRPGASDYFSMRIDESPSVEPVVEPAVINESSTGKRIASVLLLIPGGFTLNTWGMTIILVSTTPVGGSFVSGIFLVVACVFIVPALFLWGRKRWRMVLGVMLVSLGMMLVMIPVALTQIKSLGPAASQPLMQMDPQVLEKMIQGPLISGIAFGVLGTLLIMHQRARDKKAKTAAQRAVVAAPVQGIS